GPGGAFIMRRMIDQGTSNSFATSAIDVVAARDTTPSSEARCSPIRALIFAYLVPPTAKMRKQADAQVASQNIKVSPVKHRLLANFRVRTHSESGQSLPTSTTIFALS